MARGRRLHTLGLALIQLIYLKAMEIPQFSSRSDVSPEALIERLLHLDVPETVGALIAVHVGACG